MPYFKKLLDLLKTERDEDLRTYIRQKETLSVAERRANGLTWYPIAIRGSEMSRGDYLTVEVERTTHQDLNHQLRFGMPAILFSNHNPGNDRVEGLIAYQGGNRLKITLRTDELPEWARNGKLGIDVLFDDHSYDEMQGAVKRASLRVEQGVDHHLIKVLLGVNAPSFAADIYHYPVSTLNEMQQQALNRIVAAQQLAIVHGPPGTGKTTTLVQAIKALIKQGGKQILVVAPSNTAVDLLSEKLSDEGVNVLRIGNPARVSEKLFSLTLDSKMAGHASIKEVRDLKKQAAEYKNMAHKYKRNFGRAEKEQRKALFDEAHKLMKSVASTEQYIVEDLVDKAQVIAATLVGAGHYTIKDRKFETVVIDEAGQALEPACWIPILKAQKVVLAGDHCQLSPTIKSNEAAKAGLSTTLLEKCVALHPDAVVLLEEQYRMNQKIMHYSSGVFYQGKLKAHESVAGHVLSSEEAALAFIDTAGCGFEEQTEGTSTYNTEEAVFLLKHLAQLTGRLNTMYTVENFPSIAVISPYKQQVQVLRELLLNHVDLQVYTDKISVNTIDSFQGQERDVVYIGMTRSNDEGLIGFLTDIRRMNVAMTRARKKLVVIGDSATLSRLPFYAGFITYAEQIDAYQSAWEFAGSD